MRVYSITRKDTNLAKGYRYEFEQSMEAGEPVIPFIPLHQVIGATPCSGTYGATARRTSKSPSGRP